MPFCKMILVFVRGLIVSRAKLSLELLALRQQVHPPFRWVPVSFSSSRKPLQSRVSGKAKIEE